MRAKVSSSQTRFSTDVLGRSCKTTAEGNSATFDRRVVLGVDGAVEVLVLGPVPEMEIQS